MVKNVYTTSGAASKYGVVFKVDYGVLMENASIQQCVTEAQINASR